MYEVIFTRRARKAMSRFPRREYERVLRAIEGLAEDPKPTGARKMRGTGSLEEWRIRVGRDYRVIYRSKTPQLQEAYVNGAYRPGDRLKCHTAHDKIHP